LDADRQCLNVSFSATRGVMDNVFAEECWEADEVEGVERRHGDAPSIDEVVGKGR
jgi:hypothetical protein